MFFNQTSAADLLRQINENNTTAWTYTLPNGGFDTANIERQLERIADALDRMAPPKVDRPICHFCGKQFDYGEHLGYGTTYDEKHICADCLQVALDLFSGKS